MNEKSVLIVEDSIEWQKRLRRHLKRQGLASETAGSLEEAQHKLYNGDYLLATVDINLGDDNRNQDGLKVLDILNQKGILAIVIRASGEDNPETSTEFIQKKYKPFAYLSKHKNYNFNNFRDVIEKALAQN